MLQENAFYYLHFNGRYYLAQYKGDTILGHYFKTGNDSIYCGAAKLVAENPVLWKVGK